jgi:NADPH2:quinone reductase
MDMQQVHAAVLHGIGETPRYELFPAPVAGDDEAIVTVTAAALKPSDRLMANGVGYAPTTFPQVVGLDGVGRLQDGSRVAFMIPQPPYGGIDSRRGGGPACHGAARRTRPTDRQRDPRASTTRGFRGRL